MTNLRIGIVGLGGICRDRHVPGLQAIDDVELFAVANRTRESSERAAKEFGIPEVCDSWEELVARDDVDAVLIGTWPYLHRPVSIAALQAGKHVFCQARMAMNYREAKEMYAAAQASDRVAVLCPVPFGLRVDRAMARLLREKAIGELRLIRVESLSAPYIDADTVMNWRKDHRLSGLNMLTFGMYVEVIHRWFPWTQWVSAESQIFVERRKDESGEDVPVQIPDQFLVTAGMGDGTPIQYTFSAVSAEPKEAITLYGTTGVLRYDVVADTLYRQPWDGDEKPVEIPDSEAYDVVNWRVERDFVNAIREGKEYHPNFEDGLHYMRVLEGAYRSAGEGRRVDLDELD